MKQFYTALAVFTLCSISVFAKDEVSIKRMGYLDGNIFLAVVDKTVSVGDKCSSDELHFDLDTEVGRNAEYAIHMAFTKGTKIEGEDMDICIGNHPSTRSAIRTYK